MPVADVGRRFWWAVVSVPPRVAVALAALAGFAGLVGWGLASPVGSSPDDDYHLASIWCAQDSCAQTQNGEYEVRTDLVESMVCYYLNPQQSAACQGPSFGQAAGETTSTDRGNFSQHLYPPGFYVTMHVFAGEDLEQAVRLMRAANAAIFSIGLASLWIALPPRLRPMVGWPLLALFVPLVAFVVPSTNPSTWAFTSGFLTLPAVTGALVTQGWRRFALGLLAAIGVALATLSRADSAVFAAGAVIVAMLLTRPRQRALAVASSIVVVILLTSAQSGAVTAGLSDGAPAPTGGALADLLFANAIRVPDLIVGAVGGWSLGWFDTPVPQLVPFVGTSLIAIVVAAGMRRASATKALAFGGLALVTVSYPVVILSQTNALVGGYFQPRYLLPVLAMALAAAAYPEKSSPGIRLSKAQSLALWVVVSISAALGLYGLIRRFVVGTDTLVISLGAHVEWWPYPGSPSYWWIATTACVSFAVALVIVGLVRASDAASDDDEPRLAMPEEGAGAEEPAEATTHVVYNDRPLR